METFLPGFNNEKVLGSFLADFSPFNHETVLIGGWLPWVYARFYWNLSDNIPIVKTYDIDIAINESNKSYKESIASYLEDLEGYDKLPVYEGEEKPFSFTYTDKSNVIFPLDFMSHEFMDPQKIEKITGEGLSVIPLETVDIMLNKKNWININFKYEEKLISFNVLSPAVYFFIKGLTFSDRIESEEIYKGKKDLWSLYFVLEHMPIKEKDSFYKELKEFSDSEYFDVFFENLKLYFKDKYDKGPLAIAEILSGYMPEDIIKERAFLKINTIIEKFSKKT